MQPLRSAWSSPGVRFSGADQVSKRLIRPASELTPERKSDQPAPPPGREVEVSIEPDESAALLRLGERHALVVDDAKWNVNTKVDPS
jgi:hypothetical protein